MKNKLSDMASIAEIVGAFAVVISLIYVGIQVNDSAIAVRSAAANDANVALQNWYLQAGSDKQTSEVFYRGLTSPEALPATEEFQFLMMFHGVFLAFQNGFLLAEEGSIDSDFRDSLIAVILGVKDLPGMGRYWKQRRSYLHPDFAIYVETLFDMDSETPDDIYSDYRRPRTESEQD